MKFSGEAGADFPMTVVRPSHTYDDTMLPTLGAWTDIARMRSGRPVVVHGDGTTHWTLTHSDDFAVEVTRDDGDNPGHRVHV